MDTSFLDGYAEEDAMGPVQREEALFLYALLRLVRPRVIVEFGFFEGHSARVFCRACPESQVFSFDLEDNPPARAALECFPNFHFRHKSMSDVVHADVGHGAVDFVFFDACHEEDINMATLRIMEPWLADGAIVAVHDTGLWHRRWLTPDRLGEPGQWVAADLYAHQPGERRFVRRLRDTRPHWGQIELGTTACLRHGLSLIQKQPRAGRRFPFQNWFKAAATRLSGSR